MSAPSTIVITGTGLVSCLGDSVDQTWRAILENRSGLSAMSAMEQSLPPGRDGGQAVELPETFAPDVQREARYLRWAIVQALRQAGLLPDGRAEAPRVAQDRLAVVLGTTLHGMRAAGRFLRRDNPRDLQDFLAGAVLDQALGDLPIHGPTHTLCSACSSSLGSIAMAVTMLQAGSIDQALAGGYDTISEYVWGGFNSLKLVADGPLTPFVRGREGMKLGEAYAIVALEREADARRRGTTILARITGWGESADAYHLTHPHPEGAGAADAIRAALHRAKLEPASIDLVAAHATGTPDNDAGEYAALASVFARDLPQVPVVAYKSHLGHTLGAAGAAELILTACAMRDQVLPASRNVTPDRLEFPGLAVTHTRAVAQSVKHTLNVSIGFGGANTAIVMEHPSVAREAVISKLPPRNNRKVYITGIGVILPGIVGKEAFAQRLRAPAVDLNQASGRVNEQLFDGLLSARRVRRMSDYVKLQLAAATLACRDAGVEGNTEFLANCSAILGSMHGSSNFCESYYQQIVREGVLAANPMLFAEGVPNAGSAHLSLMLGIKGACQAVIGTRTVGLDALGLAAMRIESGVWDRAIVGAAEEKSDLVDRAYHASDLCRPSRKTPKSSTLSSSSGGVAFILESDESVKNRGGRAIAELGAFVSRRESRAGGAYSSAEVLRRLGASTRVLGSGCRTWIDRAEAIAVRKTHRQAELTGIYDWIGETFSLGPLLALAGYLNEAGPGNATVNSDNSAVGLCTDFLTGASGLRISRL